MLPLREILNPPLLTGSLAGAGADGKRRWRRWAGADPIRHHIRQCCIRRTGMMQRDIMCHARMHATLLHDATFGGGHFTDRGCSVRCYNTGADSMIHILKSLLLYLWQGLPQLMPKALGLAKGLLVTSGDAWKTARNSLTPSFSGMKMKLVCMTFK